MSNGIKKYQVEVAVDLPISFTKTVEVEVNGFGLTNKAIENKVHRKAKKLAEEQWQEGEGYGTEFELCQPEEYGMHDTIDKSDVHIMDVKGKKTLQTSSTIFGRY